MSHQAASRYPQARGAVDRLSASIESSQNVSSRQTAGSLLGIYSSDDGSGSDKAMSNGGDTALKRSENCNPHEIAQEEKFYNNNDPEDDSISSARHIALGMCLEAKNLYRKGKYDEWDELINDDSLDMDDSAENDRFALIVRRERNPDGPGLVFHSISVQSPLIREFLTKVFEGYRNIFMGLRSLIFSSPFHEFYYRWDRFIGILSDIEDNSTRQHIELLHRILAPQIQSHLDMTQDLLSNGLITFDYLWAIFGPDTEILESSESDYQLHMSRSCSYRVARDVRTFVINCEHVDYDGKHFGWRSREIHINQFTGPVQIDELNPRPTSFLSDTLRLRQRLADRGESFAALTGTHCMTYSGIYTPRIPNAILTQRRRKTDHDRVIVDVKQYYELFLDEAPNLRPLNSEYCERNSKSLADDISEKINYGEEYGEAGEMPNIHAVATEYTQLTEEDYCFCASVVHGYCLSQKLWGTFRVGGLSEVEWNTQAFDKLVLPYDYKELILAFAESQYTYPDDFDDIVSGKGQGIIMLLCGEPGVGKTLTAEAVSEQMRTPLYTLSAGELGNDALEVETNLARVLEISAKWNAILLIDECDIFLEERNTLDLQRNKLVTVFLRLLEYYKGVMFLTTNRVSTFDAAFQSRIHLTINYPSLDESSRLSIWQTFVSNNSSTHRLTAANLRRLAQMKLNGREIKNIVKTARLLANKRRKPLSIEHIETVIRVKNGNPIPSRTR